MGKLFGTDGIRGVANTYPIDAETAVAVGRAIAGYFGLEFDSKGERGRVLIGQDTRLSGDMIAQGVSAGLCSGGMNTSMLGVMPTPAVALLTRQCDASAGVVISASHNPFEDNGIKIFDSNGCKLRDEVESGLEALIESNSAEISPRQIGRIQPMANAHTQYLAFLESAVPERSLMGLKIVVDCSNGATYQLAPKLFHRMGADVVPIFCDPDGTNINQGCGSQHPETLAQQVLAHHADLGLAFDGDGDRLIAVDEKGVVLTGDQIMAICAKDLQSKGKLKGNKLVATVMSNMGFRIAMKELGIELYTTQVGDRYVMQEMISQGAVLGGEDSGHIVFRDYHPTGDGIMAALRLISAIRSAALPLSTLSEVMTVFPQQLINVDVITKPELSTIPEIVHVINEVKDTLGNNGRVLVRYSGTQSKCRIMVEGPTADATKALCQKIAEVVRSRLSV